MDAENVEVIAIQRIQIHQFKKKIKKKKKKKKKSFQYD